MLKHGTISPYSIVRLEDIIDTFDMSKPIFFDMESYNATKLYKGGFYGSIRLAQFMQEGWDRSLIVDFKYLSTSEEAGNMLYNLVMEGIMIGQNLAYDFSLLQEHLSREFPNKKWEVYKKDPSTYHDTLLYTRDLYPLQKSHIFSGRYSLDDTYDSVLGYNPYTEMKINKTKMQKSNWEHSLGELQIEYASSDVYHLPQLWNKIKEREATITSQMTQQQEDNYYLRNKISHEAVLIGVKMQDTGLTIGYDETADFIVKQKHKRDISFSKLVNLGMDKNLNINSSSQVSKWLDLPSSSKDILKRVQHLDFNDYLIALNGDDEAELRKINNSRVSKEAKADKLIKLENKLAKRPILTAERYLEVSKCMQYIMDWRGANNRVSVATKMTEVVLSNPDNRIHGHFTPTTATGRYSSSQENMQNMPRDMKGIFKAPEGTVYIGFDFAQIEIRTMCALTGEERMYEVFNNDGDIHQNTQDMCNLTQRVVAKNVNFGNLYGMGVPTFQDLLLQNDVSIPRSELAEIKRKFLATYPRIPESHEIGASNSKANRPNYSILGHPYFSKYYNQMNNMWNQASGTSEALKVALSLYKEYNLIWSPDCEINLNVHDAVLFEYKGDMRNLEAYTYAIGLLAQKAWFLCLTKGYKGGYCKLYDVPMPIEVSYSDIWSKTDKDIPDIKIAGRYYIEHMEEAEKWLEAFKNR